MAKTEKVVLTTSLYRLRKYQACKDRYEYLKEKLGPEWGDKQPINLLDILKHNGADDCLWALRATKENCDVVARLMACDFAEAVLPIYEKKYPKDTRPRECIKVARMYARGEAHDKQRDAAIAAARAARDAAGDAAWDAACAAARAAARDAAWDDAWAAARAARAAAGDAAWDDQAKIIRKYLGRSA